MQVETAKRLFTVDEYYRMAEVGILGPEDRVELIDGEIFEMSPIDSRHLACVNRATRLFVTAFANRAVVSIQHPLQLSNYTEPEPDIVLLKPRTDDYAGKKPAAEDALLVVEVAETTLNFDRRVKLPRYAKAGVREVWIENLVDDVLIVYREPVGKKFATQLALRRGESLSPIAFPDEAFAVDQLLVLTS
jgi:Uma2 family endonuclease